jgi:GTP-binding protein
MTRMTDFTNDEAVDRFQRTLESSGISAELDRLGVETGDVVHIADLELVWGELDELELLEPAAGAKGKGGRQGARSK